MVTEQEKFLWEQMDGQASLQEIATAYVLRYGSFDFETIPALITKLRRAELLTMRPASRLREVLARNQRNPAARAVEAVLHTLEKLTVTSRRSHAVFERMYRYGGFLIFSPAAVIVLAVLVVLASRSAVELWVDSGEVTKGFAGHAVVAILLVKVCFWLTVVSHQLVHALACVHYKRRVREFGFTMLHGFIPTFYARRHRHLHGEPARAHRQCAVGPARASLPRRPLSLGGELPGAGAPEGLPRRLRDPPAAVLLHQPLSVLLPRDGRLPHPGGSDRLSHAQPRRRALRARVVRPAPAPPRAPEPRGGGLPRVFRALARLRGGVRSCSTCGSSCTPSGPDRQRRPSDSIRPGRARRGRGACPPILAAGPPPVVPGALAPARPGSARRDALGRGGAPPEPRVGRPRARRRSRAVLAPVPASPRRPIFCRPRAAGG